jgi:hypothetical protein
LTNTCGLVGLFKPRNELIKHLCKFALPYNFRVVLESSDQNYSLQIEAPEDRSMWNLSFKNAQAMKSLFNVANCLGNTLGSSWLMILETFEALDKIIEIRRQFSRGLNKPLIEVKLKTQESDYVSQDELLILDFSLTKLFESSIELDDQALAHMLYCLGNLSLAALANAATDELEENKTVYSSSASSQSGSFEYSYPNMFALSRFIKAVESNCFRISKIWEFCVGHLNCVINHKILSLRNFGLSCLGKLTKTSLTSFNSCKPKQEDIKGSNKLKYTPYKMEPIPFHIEEDGIVSFAEFQTFILKPLLEILKSKYIDVKKGILTSVYDLVQNCGLIFTSGWNTILQILEDVVLNDSTTEIIAIGFKTMQLITSDFLDVISLGAYPKLLETIYAYAYQPHVINTSFASVSLLWQISDHIGRCRRSLLDGTLSESGDSVMTKDNIKSLEQTHINSKYVSDGLQLIVFDELKKLSYDIRSEVRNSSVQTLYSTIAAYGDMLSPEAWEKTFSEIIFPVLDDLCRSNDYIKNSSVASASELGRDKLTGEKFMMLMHHSRDTAEKQWNETRVHVLQGTARIFRQLFNVLQVSKNFPSYWKNYLE